MIKPEHWRQFTELVKALYPNTTKLPPGLTYEKSDNYLMLRHRYSIAFDDRHITGKVLIKLEF